MILLVELAENDFFTLIYFVSVPACGCQGTTVLSGQVFFIHWGGPRYPNQAVTLGSKCLSWLRPLNQLYENKIDLKNRPAIQICCKAVHQLRWGQGYYRTDFGLHW